MAHVLSLWQVGVEHPMLARALGIHLHFMEFDGGGRALAIPYGDN